VKQNKKANQVTGV